MGLETFYRVTCDKCGAASESFYGFQCVGGQWLCAACRNTLSYVIQTSGDATYHPGDDHEMEQADERP